MSIHGNKLILILLNVYPLVIPQLRKDIIVIVLFFTATLLAPMSHLLSLFPIFPLIHLPLSPMSRLFRCMFHFSLILSCCLQAHLLLSRFIHIGHTHQLLHRPSSSFSSSDPLSLAYDSLPIALQKGTRFCTTKHPISQFVSTSSLSHSHSCFLSFYCFHSKDNA